MQSLRESREQDVKECSSRTLPLIERLNWSTSSTPLGATKKHKSHKTLLMLCLVCFFVALQTFEARAMWGIVPAAGIGSRIQPLAFSKELLPVGSRRDGDTERPRAVSEYLLDRMVSAGATKICFVIAPAKSDVVDYYGGRYGGASICYAVQQRPNGLCDAVFTALPFIDP